MPPLWWGAAVAALLYVGIATAGVKSAVRWVKVVPAALLAALLAPVSLAVAAGMLASGVGDAFLLEKDRYFLHGLASFLVGHLCFAAGFLGVSGAAPSPAFAAGLLTAVVAATAWILPPSGKLRIAVPIYVLALAGMALAASTLGPLGVVGGLLFVLSDGLLAVHKFKRPVPARDLLVNATYFAALQALSAAVLAT